MGKVHVKEPVSRVPAAPWACLAQRPLRRPRSARGGNAHAHTRPGRPRAPDPEGDSVTLYSNVFVNESV